jgi:hypothetical protein
MFLPSTLSTTNGYACDPDAGKSPFLTYAILNDGARRVNDRSLHAVQLDPFQLAIQRLRQPQTIAAGCWDYLRMGLQSTSRDALRAASPGTESRRDTVER